MTAPDQSSNAFMSAEQNRTARRNAFLLSAGQATGGANGAIIISAGSIAGHMLLGADKSLATLPVTSFILGAALSTIPANMIMQALGRRGGYFIGCSAGILAGLIAALGLYLNQFWIFTAGLLISGVYWAFVQSYRFAAADAASDTFKAKAISWVMAGGVAAAIIGPQTVIWTKELFQPFLFLGTFLAISVLALIAMPVVTAVRIEKPKPAHSGDGARPLSQIIRQPRFVVAALCGATSFASMSLVMTASPLAMVGCGLSTTNAALGIQWHVLAMYLPSFFTGHLIARFGKGTIVATGLILIGLAAVVALHGITLMHFWTTLILLGLGWNLGFIGSTALLTDCHAPAERNKVQGLNDFMVFGFNALASFSSGLLLTGFGWDIVNLVVFPGIIASLAGLLWLAGTANRRVTA